MLYRLLILSLFIFSSSVYSAASGYVPTATVTPGVSSSTIKTYMSKLGTLPTDTLAKIYPSIASGAQIVGSSVGAAASSVYSGSAAVLSKMVVPLQSGANLAMNMVANIPKAQLAAGALAVLKSPYLAVAVAVGSALYQWYDSAGLKQVSPGVYGIIPPSVIPVDFLQWVGTFTSTQVIASTPEGVCEIYPLTGAPDGYSVYFVIQSGQRKCRYLYNGNDAGLATNVSGYGPTGCPDGYTISGSVCNRISSDPTPVPTSDSDALNRLNNNAPSNPAGVLPQLIQNGVTPDTDLPVLTVDPVPSQVTTRTNPDGTKRVTTVSVSNTVSGNTVTSTTTTTEQEMNESNVITATTTTVNPTKIDPLVGTTPGVTAPLDVDLTPVVNAINTARDRAHDDSDVLKAAATQAHADALAEPQAIMDAVPLTSPSLPPVTPDTDSYFDFLNTTNPFSFNPSNYLPSLPLGECVYEIHREIFGRPFDFAPCDALQPLRVVFAWAFSVLTLWSCFMIIFGARW